MLERKGTYFYLAPTYEQAKKIVWNGMDGSGMKFTDRFPKEIVSKINQVEMTIELVNGSILQLVGTDRIDSLVGTNPVGCVFTEYSLHDPKAWELLAPILAENGGWAVFVYTPRGMNHGWKLLQTAKQEGWFWEIQGVEDTGAIPQEILDEQKRILPLDLYDQEWNCKFIEGGGQFFRNIEQCLIEPKTSPELGAQYRTGVDLAKSHDFSVLTNFDMTTFEAYKQDVFNQIDFVTQKAKIEANGRRFNNAEQIVDGTGLGAPIVDDLKLTGLRIVPIIFTSEMRTALLTNLQLLLEQKRIRIPKEQELIDQLKSFQYVLKGKRVAVEVPNGVHDDRVMSLALAVWDLPMRPLPKVNQSRSKVNIRYDSMGRPMYG